MDALVVEDDDLVADLPETVVAGLLANDEASETETGRYLRQLGLESWQKNDAGLEHKDRDNADD